jgi:hypothetical protein
MHVYQQAEERVLIPTIRLHMQLSLMLKFFQECLFPLSFGGYSVSL